MRIVRKELLGEKHYRYSLDQNAPFPCLDENNVLIQVKACGLSQVKSKIWSMLTRKTSQVYCPIGSEISGIISEVGSAVTRFSKGDEVVGIIPLDSSQSGCSDYIVLNEPDVVLKPEKVSFIEAAGYIGDALKAYTALHYLGHICTGDVVLVFDGASSWGCLALQLAHHWGAKIITTASTDDEKLYLSALPMDISQIIELKEKSNVIPTVCLEETGGLGVDIIIDNGVCLFSNEDDKKYQEHLTTYSPNKHDIISSLAVGGRWITSQFDLQLDPPDSLLLHMKNASVGFLFEHSWNLSTAQQGKFQHILKSAMEKLADRIIIPNIQKIVSFDDVPEVMDHLQINPIGKIVMSMN